MNKTYLKCYFMISFIIISLALGIALQLPDILLDIAAYAYPNNNVMNAAIIGWILLKIFIWVLCIIIFSTILDKKVRQLDAEKKKHKIELSNLFTSIVHDLKTPITTITGYSQALVDGTVVDSEKQTEYLKYIHRKSERLNELIEVLFIYTKLDNEAYVLNFQNIDVVELLRESIANLYEDFEAHNMELLLELPENPVIISADIAELSRVFINIALNAIQHNPMGTKLLCEIKYNKEVQITIADNGNDIPIEISESIFSPFVMGDTSRNSRDGSGLGLSISKKIIERHKGSIQISRDIPNYTKAFIIYLSSYDTLYDKKRRAKK